MAGSKRGNSAGSVYELTGKKNENRTKRWVACITRDGARKYLYAETQQEAQRLLNKALHDRDTGVPAIKDERQTLAAYLTSWLETIKPLKLRESAWISYEHRVRLYLVPKLGGVKLSKLTTQHVKELQAWMVSPKPKGKGLSARTANHTRSVLSHALGDAVKDGTIPRNVAAQVKPLPTSRHKMTVYTPAQVEALLKAAQGADIGAIVTVAVTTGARLGELLALRWRDVELDAARIHVRKGRSRGVEGWTDADPKTDAGKRTISLTSAAVEALRAHREAQIAHRKWLGAAWHDFPDYVFPNQLGEQQFHSVVEHAFDKVIVAAKIPRIRFHDLRHTAATLMLLAGVPVAEVSEMLGHADPAVTYRVYAHTLKQGQRQAVAAMERIINGGA